MFSGPLFGQEELLYMENFEDPAREIIIRHKRYLPEFDEIA